MSWGDSALAFAGYEITGKQLEAYAEREGLETQCDARLGSPYLRQSVLRHITRKHCEVFSVFVDAEGGQRTEYLAFFISEQGVQDWDALSQIVEPYAMAGVKIDLGIGGSKLRKLFTSGAQVIRAGIPPAFVHETSVTALSYPASNLESVHLALLQENGLIQSSQVGSSSSPPRSSGIIPSQLTYSSGRGGFTSIPIKSVPSYYAQDQLEKYLDFIGCPLSEASTTLEFLARIMRGHLTTFTFTNVDMHYTEEHFMDVRPQALFDSMVLQRHGSYCFGQNTLLLGMLRALGFRCYSGCARVNGERLSTLPLQLSTITHMILFVNPSDSQSTYLIDVAFGARCLARPIKVEAGEMVKGSAAPEEHRLIRLAHPNSAIEAEDWALQMRCGSMIPDWVVQYQFSINEFFPEDHEALSFALCKRPNRTFGVDILAVKCFHVEGEGNDGRIGDLGRLSLALGRVKRVIGDQSSIIRECSTELERIQALRELFGIDIHDSDATHVKDQPFALLN